MKSIHQPRRSPLRRTPPGNPLTRAGRAAWNYLRDWPRRRRAAAADRRRAALTVDNLRRSVVDLAALETLRRRCAEADGRPDYFWTKYLDTDKWLSLNIRYANELGLVERPPRRVLDLGCGGGYFLAVCRQLGASVRGVDLDQDAVLNELIRLFRIERTVCKIKPIVKLPDLGDKFDLITAWMVCFNLPLNRPAWNAVEWDFLLADLATRLRPGGRIVLSLNRQLDDDQLYNDEVKAYFESVGAVIEGKRLTFTDETLKGVGRISAGAAPRPKRKKRLQPPDAAEAVPLPPAASPPGRREP